MQKWEYLHVNIESGTVVKVNGQQVARLVTKKYKGTKYNDWEGETIESYLVRAGEDGWELVTDSAYSEVAQDHTLIFKRPKP